MSEPAIFLDFSCGDIDDLLDNLAAEPRLALDTEADPFHRYFEKICLLQLSTSTGDFFFDPLEHGMPDRMRALLTDPSRTIVMHGADYDVRTLKRSFDLALVRLIDTGLAAQLLGRPNTGLKALLEEELEIMIDKGEQRSDWGQRPLTEKQLVYARQDTQHLLPLADVMLEKLDALGRVAWLEEECALLLQKDPAPKIFDASAWRKIKGAKVLPDRGRQTLAALFVWREEQSKSNDRPPFRIMRNDALLRLAAEIDQHGLLSVPRLKRLSFVPKWIDRVGLHTAIEEGLAGEVPDARPPRRKGKPGIPHTPASKGRLEKLRDGRAEWAVELGMDSGFLVSGAVLESIAKNPPENQTQLLEIIGMTRWRVESLGDRILDLVKV